MGWEMPSSIRNSNRNTIRPDGQTWNVEVSTYACVIDLSEHDLRENILVVKEAFFQDDISTQIDLIPWKIP